MTNAEKEVATLLKELGIQWTYEQPVFIWDENKKPRVCTRFLSYSFWNLH